MSDRKCCRPGDALADLGDHLDRQQALFVSPTLSRSEGKVLPDADLDRLVQALLLGFDDEPAAAAGALDTPGHDLAMSRRRDAFRYRD